MWPAERLSDGAVFHPKFSAQLHRDVPFRYTLPSMSRLLSLVGTPSPKLHAVLNIVRGLVQITVGDHVVVVANSSESLRDQFPDRPTRARKSVVLLSDYPQPDMLAMFYRLRAPVVVCVDDFTTVALFSVVSRGFGGVDAARFATMGVVNVEPAVASPPPTSLLIGDPKVETLEGLIAKLGAFYRLPTADDSLAKALAFVGFAGRGGTALGEYIDGNIAAAGKMAVEGRAALESRSPLENELIASLAPHYDVVARGRRLEKLEWPVYALLRPEFPDRLTIGPIDLTGPARHVYFGPYFALPAGVWSAHVSLEVQDCLSENRIGIDVFASKVLSVVHADLPPHGVYGCEVRFEIEDPSKPVEIRVQLLTGAIEGVILLRKIELHRLSSLDEVDEEDGLVRAE